MTIKRRLFLANVVMILSPILLVGLIFLSLRSFLIDEQVLRGSRGSIPVINEQQRNTLFEGQSFEHLTEHASLYRLTTGDYVFVLTDDAFTELALSEGIPVAWLAIFIYLVAVVFLANLWIAKYISKKIMTPLNTLVEGVEEIKSGNLSHRIAYRGSDEFDLVCDNFNDMAVYLSEMVEKQLADEKSRKVLIAGISHDLRTPLTSIKMCVDGFKSGAVMNPEKQEKYVDIIGRKTSDLEYIIKQLFLFSKMDMGDFPLNLESVDMGCEIEGMIKNVIEDQAFSDFEISVTNALRDEHVLIDLVQFENVVQNILGNSVKYAKREDVKIDVLCEKVEPNVISISLQDNGVGVPEEMLDKIFDVFYRGDRSRNNRIKGSGLGLAISSKIIGRFGGKIRAKHVESGGLNVVITLPIQEV